METRYKKLHLFVLLLMTVGLVVTATLLLAHQPISRKWAEGFGLLWFLYAFGITVWRYNRADEPYR